MSGPNPWVNPPSGRNAQTFDNPTFTGNVTATTATVLFATIKADFVNSQSGNTVGLQSNGSTVANISPGTGLRAWTRFNQAQGAAVASANSLALGTDGNRFQISGTTQINLLDNSNWMGGSIVVLMFLGVLTVKHNQAASGNNKPIYLKAAADLTTAAKMNLVLQYDSTDSTWYELSH